jgi:Cd2+/Zn2+-exporting ATPase
MAHDVIDYSAENASSRTSLLIVGILLGGVLLACSYVAPFIPMFSRVNFEVGGKTYNFFADVLALLGALLLGIPVIAHAVKGLLHGHAHMDELVALAIVAALVGTDYRTAGVVAFFLLLANLVETRTALGAKKSIEALMRITPTKAHRLDASGAEEQVDPDSLSPGDVVRVRPGDNVPADGEIISGRTSINEANVTGESIPVDKGVGAEVFSGTNNQEGVIDVRVTRAGEDTTLGKVRKLILQAQGTRIPIMRLMDQYAAWYTPTILMLAGIVLFFTRNEGGMEKAITMLVVACPCALILAMPTAMVAALTCAARLGVLIKNVSSLEQARQLSAIVLDKTGTLTTGELAVTRLQPAPGVEGEHLLTTAASLEQMSKHPVAQAVVQIARKARVELAGPEGFEETAGRGVAGRIDGRPALVGRRTWLAEQGVDMSALEDESMTEPEGLSTLYVAEAGRVLGWVGLEDRTRPEARRALEELRELGIRERVMVTGDRWSVARRVAREMGCTEVQAEVLPADKLDLVAALRKQNHAVAVVGDGVNDAPALAAGDLSVAMGAAGSDVAINSASIALMNNNLERLPFLIRLSRKAIRIVHQNLAFGIGFIIVMLAMGTLGWIKPISAAVLHFLAGIVVIFNSARLVRFGEELHAPPEEPTTQFRPGAEPEPVTAGPAGAGA